jgi:hypothetical protein
MQILTSDEELAGALPIVGTAAYLRSRASSYGWFRKGDLVLSFLVERRALFNRLVFTHQTVCLRGTCPLEQERMFLNDVVVAAHGMNVDFIYQSHATAVFQAVPDGSIFTRFGSYGVNLELPLEKLWANLHGKHRNVIKKARENGVVISESPENLEACFALIDATMKRNHKLSVSLADLERLRSNLAAQVAFYVACQDNVAHGAAVLVWSPGHTAYYLYGGTVDVPAGGSMNLLHWQAMSDMKARGVREYDFVGARLKPIAGSKLESIQRFKERFGASLKQGYLWKYPLKPWRYRVFCLLARANSLARGAVYRGDIIDEERALG